MKLEAALKAYCLFLPQTENYLLAGLKDIKNNKSLKI